MTGRADRLQMPPRQVHRRLRRLPPTARLVHVVGLLTCDETGYLSKVALEHALRDPVTVAAAKRLAREWRLL
jgi:hypothetical protein